MTTVDISREALMKFCQTLRLKPKKKYSWFLKKFREIYDYSEVLFNSVYDKRGVLTSREVEEIINKICIKNSEQMYNIMQYILVECQHLYKDILEDLFNGREKEKFAEVYEKKYENFIKRYPIIYNQIFDKVPITVEEGITFEIELEKGLEFINNFIDRIFDPTACEARNIELIEIQIKPFVREIQEHEDLDFLYYQDKYSQLYEEYPSIFNYIYDTQGTGNLFIVQLIFSLEIKLFFNIITIDEMDKIVKLEIARYIKPSN